MNCDLWTKNIHFVDQSIIYYYYYCLCLFSIVCFVWVGSECDQLLVIIIIDRWFLQWLHRIILFLHINRNKKSQQKLLNGHNNQNKYIFQTQPINIGMKKPRIESREPRAESREPSLCVLFNRWIDDVLLFHSKWAEALNYYYYGRPYDLNK